MAQQGMSMGAGARASATVSSASAPGTAAVGQGHQGTAAQAIAEDAVVEVRQWSANALLSRVFDCWLGGPTRCFARDILKGGLLGL